MNITLIGMEKKISKVLLVLFILLEVVIPVIILLPGIGFLSFYLTKGWFGTLNKYLFLLVNMPVYAIYGYKLFSTIFPVKIKQQLLLFIPFIVTFLLFFRISTGWFGLLQSLVLCCLPVYLGINTIFFIGLLILLPLNMKYDSVQEIIAKIPAALFLLALMFSPVVYYFLYGFDYFLQNSNSQSQTIKTLTGYFFSIGLVMFFRYKTMVKLYHQDKL